VGVKDLIIIRRLGGVMRHSRMRAWYICFVTRSCTFTHINVTTHLPHTHLPHTHLPHTHLPHVSGSTPTALCRSHSLRNNLFIYLFIHLLRVYTFATRSCTFIYVNITTHPPTHAYQGLHLQPLTKVTHSLRIDFVFWLTAHPYVCDSFMYVCIY